MATVLVRPLQLGTRGLSLHDYAGTETLMIATYNGPIANWNNVGAGDLLNGPGEHVRLVYHAEGTGDERELRFIEASPPKVDVDDTTVPEARAGTYNGMRDNPNQ